MKSRLTLIHFLSTTLIALASLPAMPSCGWTRIDHQWNFDDSGAWRPNVYRSIVGAAFTASIAGALWEGSDSRLGHTLFQTIDSVAISSVAAEAGKRIFTRQRPGAGSDPCKWFQHGSHYSFPSGEAAVAAGLVAPIVFEYGRDNPLAYSLLVLPAYIGVARVKNQAHWQSDVIAGWAIGGISGWYAHQRDVPFTVMILPRGLTVGLRKTF